MAKENEAVAEDAQAPSLSLQDMATCVQIVDLCSKRGAFEGPEPVSYTHLTLPTNREV